MRSEIFGVLVKRHSKKVCDPAGGAISVLFVKADGSFQRSRRIQGHSRAAAFEELRFGALEQRLRKSFSLLFGQHRHPAEVTLAIARQVAADGSTNRAGTVDCDKDEHRAHSLLESLRVQDCVFECCRCVARLIRREGRAQAGKNCSGIAGRCFADEEHGSLKGDYRERARANAKIRNSGAEEVPVAKCS